MDVSANVQTQVPNSVLTCHNLISGEWVTGEQGQFEVISPYNGKKIGSVSVPSQKQIHQAIENADRAQKDWGRLTHKERARVLYRFREILLRDQDAISHLKPRSAGKHSPKPKRGLPKASKFLNTRCPFKIWIWAESLKCRRVFRVNFAASPLA